jgi:5'-3' exonuclease
MGIPSFFRTVIQKNPNVIQGATSMNLESDYFFIDFNSIIYHLFYSIPKTSSDCIEDILIQQIISKLAHLINNIVQPKKYAFISMDGIAPRAKMVQQRSRRFKSLFFQKLVQQKEKDLQIINSCQWDPSSHICPGTSFMTKLHQAICSAMKCNVFCHKVYLSDSNTFGEGEHKFLNIIRKLPDNYNNIVIYSPDGDMISLALLTHKPHIYIMRIPDPHSEIESKYITTEEYIYCDCDQLRRMFYQSLTQSYSIPMNEYDILTDYNFLLFMVGNDFIPSLPFLKIRTGGLDLLIRIYNQIRPHHSSYLIHYHPITQPDPILNMEFFKELIQKLAMVEEKEMSRQYKILLTDKHHPKHHFRLDKEKTMSEIDIFKNRYQHLNYFHPDHPDYSKYKSYLHTIDYRQPISIWKSQYYSYFFPSIENSKESIQSIVIHYFESLMFTLKYYLKGCPSTSWYYKYRVSPLLCDMAIELETFDLNQIQFENKYEYSPFLQLLYILPPQMSTLLPKCLQDIFENEKMYPKEFEMDVLAGLKYIYSEAILPEIEDEWIFKEYTLRQELFTNEEQERNKIHKKLITFNKKK